MFEDFYFLGDGYYGNLRGGLLMDDDMPLGETDTYVPYDPEFIYGPEDLYKRRMVIQQLYDMSRGIEVMPYSNGPSYPMGILFDTPQPATYMGI